MTQRLRWRFRAVRPRVMSWLWLALAVAAGCGTGTPDTQRGGSATASAVPQVTPSSSAVAPAGFGESIGFRSRQRLDEHFAKHGAEFGAISRAEYLRLAQRLRDASLGGDILEIRRGDGTVSRFDRASGAFVAFDDDGIIRTFFRPNDGERYFRRQARRRAGP